MGFPVIPGVPLPDGILTPLYQYDLGTQFRYNDLSGVVTMQPPPIRQILPMVVPRVDADGNETGGVASVLHQAPLGTYTGWNTNAGGFYKGQIRTNTGGVVPFAKTMSGAARVGRPAAVARRALRDAREVRRPSSRRRGTAGARTISAAGGCGSSDRAGGGQQGSTVVASSAEHSCACRAARPIHVADTARAVLSRTRRRAFCETTSPERAHSAGTDDQVRTLLLQHGYMTGPAAARLE